MIIKGQILTETDKHLELELKDPYWSAWQRFNWPQGTEGYSISKDALNKATDLKKKILFKTKYGYYEITTHKAEMEGSPITARDGTKLVCIPKTALKKIPKPIDDSVNLQEAMVKMAGTPEWEKLRKKLHGN